MIVISELEIRKSNSRCWKCLCDCGNISIVSSHALKSNNTKSCGCLAREISSKKLTKHGLHKSSEYSVYYNFKLKSPKSSKFKFNSFEEFYEEVGKRPSKKHFIKMINTNGDYEKGNIRWETIDLKNERFGLLRVLKFSHVDKWKKNKWKCKCDCGNIKIINQSDLICGKSKSCGCRTRGNQTHGTIYGIYDKDDNLVYIGQTTSYILQKRLQQHLNTPSINMKKWLNSIDYIPKIKPIIENIEINHLDDLEIKEIQKHSKNNILLNKIYNKL